MAEQLTQLKKIGNKLLSAVYNSFTVSTSFSVEKGGIYILAALDPIGQYTTGCEFINPSNEANTDIYGLFSNGIGIRVCVVKATASTITISSVPRGMICFRIA